VLIYEYYLLIIKLLRFKNAIDMHKARAIKAGPEKPGQKSQTRKARPEKPDQ